MVNSTLGASKRKIITKHTDEESVIQGGSRRALWSKVPWVAGKVLLPFRVYSCSEIHDTQESAKFECIKMKGRDVINLWRRIVVFEQK